VKHGESGFLVEAGALDAIAADLARAMDRVALDGALAESMSLAARAQAEGWRWSAVIREWVDLYPRE
jgi:glycosyltransferase involved in cell wall biosynthesis